MEESRFRRTPAAVAASLALVLFAAGLRAGEHHHWRALHEKDFRNNPDLEATSGEVIWLDNQLPAAGPDEPLLRYRLEKGKHSFCLKGGDPYFTEVILRDERGEVVFKLSRTEVCHTVYVDSGKYTLHVGHSHSSPNPNQLTAVDVDRPSAPLHDANGNPVGGYWAISTLSANGEEQGALGGMSPPRNLGGIYANDMPLVAETTNYWDETSLFSFPANKHPEPLGPSGFFLDMMYQVSAQDDFVLVTGNHDCSTQPLCDWFSYDPNSPYRNGIAITDLGHSQFTLSWPQGKDSMRVASLPTQFSPNTMKADSIAAPQRMWLQFRYYPDSSQIGTLNQGEVAFFEKCNYQGQGAVATNSFNPSSYRINGNSNNQFFSFKLSNNTTVQLSMNTPDGDPTQSVFYAGDTACLPSNLFDANLIYPLDQILDGTGDTQFTCPNCRLVNANLSNFNIQGSNWQSADMTKATLLSTKFSADTNLNGAKFIGATLTSVSFAGAMLAGADFTAARLTCVDFSGTSQNLRDLTALTFTNVQWLPGSSCLSDFSYTKLTTKILPPAFWKYANLHGAVFVDLAPATVLSTQANPLDLTNAHLAQVNFNQAVLDYAIMPSADLTGADLRHCSLRHVNLSAGTLYGTNLNNANLDGANMSGAYLNALPGGTAATLIGAFLRNVNLFKAQLSGANLTNANFFGANAVGTGTCAISGGFTQGCASAAGATLNNTIFSQAFLFGVDFSGALIQGVQFGNAIVIGADFDNAQLAGDTQIGTGSGFPSAFLQGTNLATTAKLLSISLLDSYLDFSSQGNAFTMQLPGTHTVFPGSPHSGQPECVQMFYNSGTAAPTNNNTMTCPDGSQPSTGCGAMQASNAAWESQVGISSFGTYQFDATYTPAAQQQFCQPDNNWFNGGLTHVRK